MATSIPCSLAFGGVNDSAHPLNFPLTRSVRCKNWVPKPNGRLQLRYGYTLPTMSTVSVANVHSAAYFETWAGTQYVLLSQSTALKVMALSGGAVSSVGTLSNGNQWGHFRANNKIHLSNATDFKSYDGATLRNNGIRAPNSTETASVTVTADTATPGSFSTTTLTGYQLYLAYYNPNTGHVGNRTLIGSRATVAGDGYSLVVGGLPDISTVDSEWVKIVGRTPDGGEVPYWFIDTSADFVTVGATATTATFTCPDVDYDSELPTRNSVGSGFSAFAKIEGRVFAIKANDNYIYYSEDESDAVNGNYVGRPEESWPANNAEAFPTGEIPISIHEHGKEGWFFSKNHLIRWKESLRLQLVEPWIGPWPVGCGGQRLFCSTPHGPFWIDGNKRLCTFADNGILHISNEYQRTLLNRIDDATLSDAEMVWEFDPSIEIDRLRIVGDDSDGNKVIIIHDFNLRDQLSPYGQGYEESYAATITTLVGSGYSPFVPVRDTDGKRQSWAGLSTGRFAQLNDGTSDNAATYTADYISGPVWLGDDMPKLAELDYCGDESVTLSHTDALDSELTDFVDRALEPWPPNGGDSFYRAKIGASAIFHRLRFQLTSHPSGSTDFDVSDPYGIPLNVYGQIHEIGFVLGAGQPLGR